MSEEIEKIIFDLEGCCGMFDYMLTPIENNLLVSYIKELKQENQQLKEEIREEKLSYARLQNTLIEINEDRIIMQQVLDEIREVINKMLYQGYIDGGTQYFATGDESEFGVRANLLLQILGKVKE